MRSRASSGCRGRDVFFLTGTDEHGLKMAQTARERGVEPGRVRRGNVVLCSRQMDDDLEHLLRSLHPHHRARPPQGQPGDLAGDGGQGRPLSRPLRRLVLGPRRGLLWRGGAGRRRQRREAVAAGHARSNGRSRRAGSSASPPIRTGCSRITQANPDFIRPESRRNEVLRFVEGGLTDLSISRTSFDWGVKVPGSPNHVMYVWLDALTNYLTGVGYPDDTEAYRKYWPADLHIIGKDVVRFHAVYWPAFLMSAGIALPKQVFGHGFLLSRGEKMSKSVGNVVDPLDLIRRLRRRPAALFPAARGHLRPGRRLQRRGDRHQGQCRSRQQLRQPRPAHACRSSPRIATACCRRAGKGDAADAAACSRSSATRVREETAGPFRGAGALARHRGLAARGLRLQPIYRRPGALGAAEDRSRSG